MKGLIAATLAIYMVSSISAPSYAKSKKDKADKKQIALTLQGGTTAEKTVNPKSGKGGVGSDFTSVWSGGYSDINGSYAGGGM
jgi:hypothetical protein